MNAVLVLAKSDRLSLGHVAMVRRIDGPRKIEVTHANWGMDEYTRRLVHDSMPVIDVSPNNDWTRRMASSIRRTGHRFKSMPIMTLLSPQTLAAAALLREAVATTVMPLFRNLAEGQIHQKQPGDYVTQADEDCEAFMIPRLQALAPGSKVVGEEGVSQDPSILSNLSAPHVWVLDPVDGTILFKNGEAKFGALLASVKDGKVDAGVVLEVYADTAGNLHNRVICAEAGRGVWISEREGVDWKILPPFNQRPKTSIATLDSQYFVPGFLNPSRAGGSFAWIDETAAAARTYSEFARTGLSDPEIAGAKLDAYVSAPARWWDHLAGTLIVRMLDGVVRTIDTGENYGVKRMTGGLVAARDVATADLALKEACNGEMLRQHMEPCAPQHLVKTSLDTNGLPQNAHRNRPDPYRSPA